MEAGEPDPPVVAAPAPSSPRGPAIGEHSDAEISISMDADEPPEEEQGLVLTADEPSAPEILVVTPGRPITAEDAVVVGGSISEDGSRPRRPKRVTDSGD